MPQLNYLNNEASSPKDEASQKKQEARTKQRMGQAPDSIVHTPPIVHYFLGGIGILFGFSANLWQVFTTIIALVSMMSPPNAKINYASLGWKLAIAILIACATQFGLTILVWRIDTTWKRKNAGSPAGKPGDMIKGYGLAAVEVVQHVDLVTFWGLLAFAVEAS